jgi:recombination protein RecT
MAIDVRTKTQEVVAAIDNPVFLQQIEDSLPEGVSMQRFVSVAKTAVRTNADLATADQTSLFGSIVRCAQDGLLPDGREAALVIYKGKVGYLPMIGGIRRIAAVYGWQIRTNVVYANDEFDYTDEPPEIKHRPVRPGEDRGNLIAAYAVATHRDGRRVQTVLHPDEIAKRRSKAQTTKVWDEWTAAMWEKSAGHDIFKQLSLDPADARVDRILREGILADPIAALYGGNNLRTDAEPSTSPDGDAGPHRAPVDGAKLEAAAEDTSLPQAAASPDPEAEDAEWTEAVDESEAPTDEEIQEAAETKVPGGSHMGQTLAEVAESDVPWLRTQLKRLGADDPMRAPIEAFVHGRLPEVWAKFEAWKAEQS